ncbi:MAG: DUF4097 family beta strand repeat-containing protein [Bacilli bacterium]
MTSTQKIIKYLAASLAIFLIITIMSAILSGVYMLFNVFGVADNDYITNDLKTISNETIYMPEISSLKIDLEFTNLEIITGDTFSVETNNSKISYKNNNGSIKIKEENRNWLNKTNNSSNLIIYIPENMALLDEVNITSGAGKLHIEKLNTQRLNLELGAGDVNIENLIVLNEGKIDGGAGKIELKYSEINNLEANLGVGEFNFVGKLSGKSEIDSGIGQININLLDSKENYRLEIDKGIGNVTIDDEELQMNRIYGTGSNYLDIDGGVGSIKINFKEE